MVKGIDASKTEETAAPPRPASTVILVREANNALQVYLLKRSARSDFMPGNFVFPGGVVEPGDDDPDFWSGRMDGEVEAMPGNPDAVMSHRQALAHAVAAIRETLEEAGIFLGSDHQDTVDCRPIEGYNSARGFRDWVTAEGRVLGVSRLHPWSHWITPIVRPKRYDTRFYLAVVTEGAKCTPDREETTQGIWMTPERAIEENERGRILLSPPTLVTLHELLAYNDRVSLKGALRTRSWGRARIPRLGNLSDGVFFLLPWDPHYGQNGSEKGHTVGVPFSRLHLDGEIWHVVAKGTVED